jgi:hypothetical protein
VARRCLRLNLGDKFFQEHDGPARVSVQLFSAISVVRVLPGGQAQQAKILTPSSSSTTFSVRVAGGETQIPYMALIDTR